MKLSSPILAFTLVSAGIHTGIFMMTDSADLVLPGSTGSTMLIKLDETASRNESHQSKNRSNKASANGQKKLFKPEKNNTEDVKPPVKQQQTDSAENQKQETATFSKKNAQLKAQVISVVYEQFNNHFNYPRIAQRQNWQGKVLLTFRITTKGEIKNIKVNHSSGFEILDQAAVNSLKKIGKLPQLSTGLNSAIDIQLPIIYQLTEG